MGCNKMNCQKHKRNLTPEQEHKAEWKERSRKTHRDVVKFLKKKHEIEELAKTLPEMYFK